MAKSTKFSSKVPSLADYQFTFMNEDGEIENPEAVKKAFHTLMTDKAKAQDAREDVLAEKTELAQERDELQTKVDDKNAPDAQAEIAKATKRADTAEAEAKKAIARADKLEVAAEKGLTPAQAKRLQGDTKEELEADADEILEAFPVAKADPDDEDLDDDDNPLATQPRSTVRLTNGGDPSNSSTAEPDYEAIAAELDKGRIF